MIPYHLLLDYALQPGWLAPFVEGLREGRALGRQCTRCRATSFPPHRVCACGGSDATWEPLSGVAEVVVRTDGADGAFALVRFEGADTLATVRVDDLPADAARGRLPAGDQQLPQLRVVPLHTEQGA